MKKITILSIVAATVLFTGCGEDSKKATAAATEAVESTKEAVGHAVDAVKEAGGSVGEAADKAVEATKEAAEATKKAASDTVDSAKESVATAATAVTDTATNIAGAAAYAKCAGCHGADGKTLALGKSPAIAGQSKEELIIKLNGYRDGTINVSGMGTLMKGQVASMDDAAIDSLAAYISTMK